MAITVHQGDLPKTFKHNGSVAVDTETLGLNPLRDRLCVVQISSGDGDAHLVQLKPEDFDKAENLKALMEDPDVLKIFHFARFDVAVMMYYLNIICAPVYCTKIASKLIRTYTDRHGLKDLAGELLGMDMNKKQQSSDWAADVLSPEQQEYAANDVLYLHAMKEKLDAMLVREGRLELAEDCFRFLPVRAELDLLGWSESDIFAHK